MQYKKFVSAELSSQLWKEYVHKIHPFIEWFIQTYPKSTPSIALGYFNGIPADPLRRLFTYLIFQEVFVLLFEKHDSEAALKLVKKHYQINSYYWGNHELDLIESGKLLPAKCD